MKHCERCGSIESKIMKGTKICVNCYNEEQIKVIEEIEKAGGVYSKNNDITREELMKELTEEEPEEKNEIKKIEKIWKDRKRKSEQNMSNYKSIIEIIKRKIDRYKYKQTLIAESIGISKFRLSQILNLSREANGGELINLMVLTQEYSFKQDEE